MFAMGRCLKTYKGFISTAIYMFFGVDQQLLMNIRETYSLILGVKDCKVKGHAAAISNCCFDND